MQPLATAIAQFHERAERRADHGGATGMAWVVDGNAAGLRRAGRRHPRRCGVCRSHPELARATRAASTAARRETGRWLRAAVPRRSPPAQHRPARWPPDAVRRDRVQRRDRLHRRALRPGVPADGPVAAPASATCERRLERLPGRERRPRRRTASPVVPLLPRRGAGEDQRHRGQSPDPIRRARASFRRWPGTTW